MPTHASRCSATRYRDNIGERAFLRLIKEPDVK